MQSEIINLQDVEMSFTIRIPFILSSSLFSLLFLLTDSTSASQHIAWQTCSYGPHGYLQAADKPRAINQTAVCISGYEKPFAVNDNGFTVKAKERTES